MDEKLFTKFVSSFVFGDGALSSTKAYNVKNENKSKRNSKYYFKQLSIHQDYVDFQKEILESATSVSMVCVPAYVDSRGYACKEQTNLYTRCLPIFTRMRERLYFQNSKQIDPHYIKMWDVQTVAFFYMDNGWIENAEQKTGNIYTRIGLATHAYSYGDVVLIKKWMKEIFDFNFDIKRHKQKSGEYKFYLRNSKDNSKRFLEEIHPYCFPSFEYKFSTERFTPYKLCKGDDIV